MQIIADLQLHSKYSRAVSQKMDLYEIASWASKKGIDLVATGDWTHPIWFREISAHLKETTPGIFKLKNKYPDVSFLLSGEVSSIYSMGGQLRRVHNLIFSPSLDTCEKVIAALEKRGAHLMSDGRPIVGIPSHQLLELTLGIDENVLFIPAHVWTPWFALYGSKSGFDSIEECFGTMSKYIYAVETGLSSDPAMNWQIKDLDSRSIVSFSDAHSGPKLGREATVFVSTMKQSSNETMDYSYNDIADAIKQKIDSKLKIGYTIEFFPEEGKYHWSGHRSCNIRYNAEEVKKNGVICPVCKKPITVGVENRVLDLAARRISLKDLIYLKNKAGLTFVYDKDKKRRPFVSTIPLLEVLVELTGSPTKGFAQYNSIINSLGTEFEILLRSSYEDIELHGGIKLRQAIQNIRERTVSIDPGYDGVFGKIKVLNNNEEEQKTKEKPAQPALF